VLGRRHPRCGHRLQPVADLVPQSPACAYLRCGRIVAPLQDVAERTDELVEHAAIKT
jgi:hypothetical protein